MTERDQGPQPSGNIRDRLPELAAEGYHIAYCGHCREDASRRRAAWKTLDTTRFKVVLVGCIECYVAELRTAVRALAAAYIRGGDLKGGIDRHRGHIVGALLTAMDGIIGGGADPYRDAKYPERLCDNCHKPYRGPAIYCSFDCARKDG